MEGNKLINSFVEPLKEYVEFNEICEDLKKGRTPIQISGCVDVQRCHLMQAAGSSFKYRVIVTYNDIRGRELCDQYRIFDSNTFFYPAKDFIFYQADIQGKQLVKQRMKIVENLIRQKPCTVIVSIDGGMDRRLPLKVFRDQVIILKTADIVDMKELQQKLRILGYEKQSAKVENPGEYSVHGGIMDIYPLLAQAPYRIEFWDDEIDTIRVYDAASQRSIERVEEIYIGPVVENIFSQEKLAAGIAKLDAEAKELVEKYRAEFKTEEAARITKTIRELKENLEFMYYAVSLDSYITSFTDETENLFDYFPKEDTVFFIDEPARVAERAQAVELEFRESMINRLEKGYIITSQMDAVISAEEVLNKLALKRLATVSTMYSAGPYKAVKKYNITARNVATYQNDFEGLINDLGRYKKQKYKVLIVSPSKTRAMRLSESLMDYDIIAGYSDDPSKVIQPGEISIISGNLIKGFEYPLIKFVALAESDIFGAERKQRKVTTKPSGNRLADFNKLKIGDYVIHENHGLGIYRGIFKIENDHKTEDYIKIEYGGGGTLFVPITSLNLIQKYSSADAAKKPKLNKLGTVEWKNTKAKVRQSVNEIAEELVELYAKRSMVKGFAYSPDTVWQAEFEEMFPYEETTDQLKAIEETKADMESTKIMDRLICGDVGYGKTEVALRAAFKAVQDSKQVAVLVPTTILAQQHYNTFTQRLKDFPVKVEVLSRFRSSAEQKQTVNKLKKGEVDIVIGTHRLLSKDVSFKNLGLLIVDEEQRFGVTHKEKIKQLKNSVDVLTLSATPIPRTMHMSLIGIRDMSVLEEPPVDRQPIQTYCMEHNDELIREAIIRELSRNGQVYYVFNQISGIEAVANRVREMVPDANVAYAHGRMRETELEKLMLDFINGEIDVLVSTTIIETGMDIANVNTMIIDNADRFGLSTLYQLRGRIGRSNRTAYAFLMYQRDKILREEAEKRLAAIREFTELGAGYKIAMKDLEIRGAGNLLGERQSGHMSIVGYDLYCKMLNEAVGRLKGITEESDEYETRVELDMSAYIPSTYIKNEILKLDTYKEIASIETKEDVIDMQEELVDRFGDLPGTVNNLIYASYIRSLAHKYYVTEIKQKGHSLCCTMFIKAPVDAKTLDTYVKGQNGRCRFDTANGPVFTWKLQGGQKTGTPTRNLGNSSQVHKQALKKTMPAPKTDSESVLREIAEIITGMEELFPTEKGKNIL
jgi:transcription-repair coupling factor (superfamily II helicase)